MADPWTDFEVYRLRMDSPIEKVYGVQPDGPIIRVFHHAGFRTLRDVFNPEGQSGVLFRVFSFYPWDKL